MNRQFTAVLLLLLAGCMAKTPEVRMRFVDAGSGAPVAGARAFLCGMAWEGTMTGHGGARTLLFEVSGTTDANGDLALPAQEFAARPFGMSTNYEFSRLLISKPGFETQSITNWGAALGEFAAVSTWGYNGATIKLVASAETKPEVAARHALAKTCSEILRPPSSSQVPPPREPPGVARPVLAPQDPKGQARSAAQPAGKNPD